MELKNTIPEAFIQVDEDLVSNIKENGLLSPILICNNQIVDGHARFKIAKELKLETIPQTEISGKPMELFLNLNRHKRFSPIFIGWLYQELDNTGKELLLKLQNISPSPQMLLAIDFIGKNWQKLQELGGNTIPINIWRELAYLGDHLEKFAFRVVQLNGTISEKRLVSVQLHQCARKNIFPETLESQNAKEVITQLKTLSEPRRTEALKKYKQVVNELKLPKGVTISIDDTFEKAGVQVALKVKRKNISRLDQLKISLEELFAKIEEL